MTSPPAAEKTVAITGATGFIGAALLDLFLSRNFHVKALVRSPDKLAPWREQVTAVQGDLDNEGALAALCDGAHVVVHGAGLTVARDDADYVRVNIDGARRVAAAAAGIGARLVHLSSMSARRPEVSPYAASKFESEKVVAEIGAGVALRLPAIYGPRDLVTLPYFKLIKSGFAPEPATAEPARASILYVSDAAAAILCACEQSDLSGVYEVGDDRVDGYAWAEIGETLAGVFGRKAMRLRAPRAILSAYHRLAIAGAKALGRPPPFRTGQINEFFHDDWAARERVFQQACDWRPQVSLKEGFAKTVHWYQENGYL